MIIMKNSNIIFKNFLMFFNLIHFFMINFKLLIKLLENHN